MPATKTVAALDLGASGGRCALGRFDGERLVMEIVHRFPNGPVELHGHWFWNALGLYQGVKDSLVQAARRSGPELASLGIDTWGVDFALLDSQGKLAGDPYCARDPQTRGIYAHVFERITNEALYAATGIQNIEHNSLGQLLAMQLRHDPAYENARTFLHFPDLMNYWLTGQVCCEYTQTSTSQLIDVYQKTWSRPVLQSLGFPETLFPQIVTPGQALGPLRASVAAEINLPGVQVIATASHDTAAAVAALPVRSNNFGYISSGTWALVGRELDQPLVNQRARQLNLANEGGAFGKITFLKNLANLWLAQEVRRDWALRGTTYSWDEMAAMAAEAQPFLAFIDPDDPAFVLPGGMPEKIQRYCGQTGQPIPQSCAEILRCIFESLAFKYQYANLRFTRLTGQPVEMMHIIGGGSQNRLLNQFAANALNLPVASGPSEATALGNLLVQMSALGWIHSLEEGRELVAHSYPICEYFPECSERWAEQYQTFLQVTNLSESALG